MPLSRWTGPELLAELTRATPDCGLSASSVLRILAEHPVKPWQYQSWIAPRDPDFAAKAAVILDLYQGYYQGAPLQPGSAVENRTADSFGPAQAGSFQLSQRPEGLGVQTHADRR